MFSQAFVILSQFGRGFRRGFVGGGLWVWGCYITPPVLYTTVPSIPHTPILPPPPHTHTLRSRELGNTVNERAIRILLESILVIGCVHFRWNAMRTSIKTNNKNWHKIAQIHHIPVNRSRYRTETGSRLKFKFPIVCQYSVE